MPRKRGDNLAAGFPLAPSELPGTLEVMFGAAVMQLALPLLLSSATTTADVDPLKLFKPAAPVPPEGCREGECGATIGPPDG